MDEQVCGGLKQIYASVDSEHKVTFYFWTMTLQLDHKTCSKYLISSDKKLLL